MSDDHRNTDSRGADPAPRAPSTRRGFLAGAGATAAAVALGTREALAQSPQGGGPNAGVGLGADRRRLGQLEVSALGLGVQNVHRTFHTIVPERADMHALIRTAFDEGVTFFDCAEVYGPFECERILGEAMAGFRDEIQITTKFGFDVNPETGVWGGGVDSRPESIRRAVEGSLRRLGTDRVDLLYQHRVDPEVPIEDVAGTVGDLVREGKALHWGMSEMGIETLRRAHAELPVAAVQNEYSMLYRGAEADVIPVCEELGIGFVPFAPLGYGFLTGAIDMGTSFAPADFRALTSRMDPENREANLAVVDLARTWAERKETTPARIALAWLLAQGPSFVPIPGTTNMAHLRDNLGGAGVSFTDDELAELTAALDGIEVEGERAPDLVASWSYVEAPPAS